MKCVLVYCDACGDMIDESDDNEYVRTHYIEHGKVAVKVDYKLLFEIRVKPIQDKVSRFSYSTSDICKRCASMYKSVVNMCGFDYNPKKLKFNPALEEQGDSVASWYRDDRRRERFGY